ncbi:MAG: glycosyltransferase [Bellilinea sp.]|jgi:glycosyltransferase involved in cell wall biosynthesis/predicted  nucleic acid-binding Zn-ribbon protein
MRKLFLENYNNVLTKTKSYFEIVEKIEFADAVVVWNDVLPEYRELLTKSALLGKPSLVMQHGLRATREYAVPYNKPLFSDRIMVWGPKDKQRLTNAGVEQERIIVTGSEIFDRFNNLEKLPHNGKNIVFAPMHWYEDLDENLMVASQLRRLCAEDNRFNIITKVVDSKNSEYYDNPVSSIAHEPNHLDVCASVLTRADLVVSVTESTFEFLAYMLDIPVIVVDVWKPKYHMDRLFIKNINADISKACLLVPIERLGEAIYRTLEEPKKLSPERKNALYDEAAIGWDNKSAVERIVDTVNSAIDNKEQFNAGTYLRSLSREISKKENQIQKYIARLHEDKGSVIQMEASHREKSKNKKVRAEINFLDFPICFLKPDRVSDSAWIEHVPFGMFLIDILRPRTLVELGTYTGVSYCSFCQTVKNLGIDTKCFAIDTWEGDEHGGFYDVAVYKDLVQYHDPLYGEFSRLIKSRFDEAALYFNDTSIDFLHIDGLHTYEAVKYDFETWFPKLSERSIVLFHDTNVRERGFGVWRFYEELTQKYPHFEFLHGHGLGIVGIGVKLPEQVLGFFEVGTLKPAKVRTFFFTLGSKLSLDREKSLIQSKEQIIQNQLAERGQALEALRAELEASRGQAAGLQAQLAEREQEMRGLRAEVNASRGQAAALEAQLAEREQEMEALRAEVNASRGQAAGLEARLAEREQALEALQAELEASRGQSAGLEAELAGREQANTALTLQKAALQQELDAARAQSEQEKASLRAYQQEREQILQNLNSTLLEIYSSTAWKIIQWMWRVRLWLAPKGSRREGIIKFFLRKIKDFSIKLLPKGYSPKISVIIPVYDRVVELKQSIESILNQTYDNYEVILVTDGSPQETMQIVNEYSTNPKVRIFRYFDNSGSPVRGRNRGIKEARGEFIAFQDSDDLADLRRLELSLSYARKYKVDIVYGDWKILKHSNVLEHYKNIEDGQIVTSPDCSYQDLLKANYLANSTVMAKTSALRKVGGLKADFKYCEDYELWLRLAYRKYKLKNIPYPLTTIRLHSSNLEGAYKSNEKAFIRKALEEHKSLPDFKPTIGFVVPGVGISGGIMVVFQHANRLIQKGYDVIVFSTNPNSCSQPDWFENLLAEVRFIGEISKFNLDVVFATHWSTAYEVNTLDVTRKLYFIQSDETRFNPAGSTESELAKKTYSMNFEHVVIARWLQDWLQKEFKKKSYYVPNGVDRMIFYPDKPIEPKKDKIRVLIEGPIDIPFKGVEDAYTVVHDMDCEVWIVSNSGKPKADWRYDRFFENVMHHNMRKIYSNCDVLVKMSRVEGFFMPPLEMMSCGGTVITGKVTGYDEYIIDGYNALVVEQGDIAGARNALIKLIQDRELLNKLKEGGLETSQRWSWERSNDLLELVINGKYSNM